MTMASDEAAGATHEMCPTCSGAGTVPVSTEYVLMPADDPAYMLVQVDGRAVARVPRDPLTFPTAYTVPRVCGPCGPKAADGCSLGPGCMGMPCVDYDGVRS